LEVDYGQSTIAGIVRMIAPDGDVAMSGVGQDHAQEFEFQVVCHAA
jgi:hypothetical protein